MLASVSKSIRHSALQVMRVHSKDRSGGPPAALVLSVACRQNYHCVHCGMRRIKLVECTGHQEFVRILGRSDGYADHAGILCSTCHRVWYEITRESNHSFFGVKPHLFFESPLLDRSSQKRQNALLTVMRRWNKLSPALRNTIPKINALNLLSNYPDTFS